MPPIATTWDGLVLGSEHEQMIGTVHNVGYSLRFPQLRYVTRTRVRDTFQMVRIGYGGFFHPRPPPPGGPLRGSAAYTWC